MNSQELFYEWVNPFDKIIGGTNGQKAALLIDTFSAHGKKEVRPPFINFLVYFLPPNTKRKMQPLYACIFHN